MNQGDARSAAVAARQAVSIDGRLFDAHIVLASAYMQLGDLANAERSAEIANAVSRNTSMGLHVLGAVQCASGDTERGLENMYEAREILDSLGQITNDIAQVLMVKGDMAGAMLEIQRLVKDSTVPAGIFAGMAASLQNFGNIEAARTIWKEAEDRGLDSATAAQWRAQFPQLGL